MAKTEPSSANKRTSILEDTLLLNVVQRWAKLAGGLTLVWFLGYWGFSFLWLWITMVLYVWKERHVTTKRHRAAISQEMARDEKSVILARVEDLPSWVNFSDVERAEWVNKMIKQLWPYIGEFVEKLLRETVEPNVREKLPASLKSFKFTTIDLGDIPPRVGGVKVYTGQRRDEMHMDLELNYSSDSDVAVSIKGIGAGLRDFRLHGTLRVVFHPLINKVPLIGGMRVFFLNNPEVEFSLTSVASAFDLPGLSDMLHSIVQEQITSLMVLPNCIPIKLAEGVDINKLRYPQPEGVVRVKVVEAKELMEADIAIIGRGSSDPYVILKVGSREVRTSVKPKTLQPVWNETFEMVVDSADGQRLYVDVYDDDQGSKDDELGRVNLDLSHLKDIGREDQWLPLEDVNQGMIHLELTWLWLANDATELEKVTAALNANSPDHTKTREEDNKHVAMLLVYVDSAMNLPKTVSKALFKRGVNSIQEPSPLLTLSDGQAQTFHTKVKVNTDAPCWEENFRFMLQNPIYQNLDVEITDTKTKRSLGKLEVPIKDLLCEEDLVMDRKFPIQTSNPDSYVIMRLALRILTPRSDPKWTENEEDSTEEPEDCEDMLDTPRKSDIESGKPQENTTEETTPLINDSTEAQVQTPSKVEQVDSKDAIETGDENSNQQRLQPEIPLVKPKVKEEWEVVKEDVKPVAHHVTEPVTEPVTQNIQTPVPEEKEKDRGDVDIKDTTTGATIKVPQVFNPEVDCETMAKSLEQIDTDESSIIDVLSTRSQEQRYQIAYTYSQFHQKDLSKDMSNKLKGKLMNICVELLQSPAEMDAKALNKAMKGLGCNDEVLVEIIFTRTNEQLIKIKEAFTKLYSKDLEKEIADETKGQFRDLLLGNLQGNRSEGAEVDSNRAQEDAKALVSADKNSWGSQDSVFMKMMASSSYAQLRATFLEYSRLTGHQVEDAVRSGLSGDLRSVILMILEMVRSKASYFARVLHKSMKGLGTDDDTLVRVVASRCEVDMAHIKEQFQATYTQTLGMFIADDTSGNYRKLLLAMIGDPDAGNK